MTANLTFVETSDGSKTLYNASVGENYHSKHGALQESKHVFLNAGLIYFNSENNVNAAKIIEVGFGTGLNFLLTADYCTKNKIQLRYTGIEAFPLSREFILQTGYNEYIDSELWDNFMINYETALKLNVQLNEYCSFSVSPCKLLDFKDDQYYDVVYFDAFASVHQPEMWAEESINHICSMLGPNGVFVTYAITGQLKRLMKSNGFLVQKIPGAAGKREMLRAIRSL